MVKLAAFWLGGNSLNVSRNGTTIAYATNRIGRIGGGDVLVSCRAMRASLLSPAPP
jgi:hypothetical protein